MCLAQGHLQLFLPILHCVFQFLQDAVQILEILLDLDVSRCASEGRQFVGETLTLVQHAGDVKVGEFALDRLGGYGGELVRWASGEYDLERFVILFSFA